MLLESLNRISGIKRGNKNFFEVASEEEASVLKKLKMIPFSLARRVLKGN